MSTPFSSEPQIQNILFGRFETYFVCVGTCCKKASFVDLKFFSLLSAGDGGGSQAAHMKNGLQKELIPKPFAHRKQTSVE